MSNQNATRREFADALEQWCKLQDEGQGDTEQAYQVWETVWLHAPEWFKDKTRALAHGTGLIPNPAGYDERGNPVYSVEDIAARMSTTEEALLEEYPHLATTTPPVHRIN
jgi:hypothetical protein